MLNSRPLSTRAGTGSEFSADFVKRPCQGGGVDWIGGRFSGFSGDDRGIADSLGGGGGRSAGVGRRNELRSSGAGIFVDDGCCGLGGGVEVLGGGHFGGERQEGWSAASKGERRGREEEGGKRAKRRCAEGVERVEEATTGCGVTVDVNDGLERSAQRRQGTTRIWQRQDRCEWEPGRQTTCESGGCCYCKVRDELIDATWPGVRVETRGVDGGFGS
jgi:hypothetical protein